MNSRLITFSIILLFVLVIVNLSRSVFGLWDKGKKITDKEQRLEIAKEENRELKHKLAQVESSEYIEKQAREKLSMTREGEYVVVLPAELEASGTSGMFDEIKEDPAWKQWMELFF